MTVNPSAIESFSFTSPFMLVVLAIFVLIILFEEFPVKKIARKLFKQVFALNPNMKKLSKKGFGDVGGVYQLVLIIGLIGVVGAVMLVVLAQLGQTSAITSNPTASTAINSTITAVSSIPSTWLGIIVLIAILGVIVFLLVRSMGFFGGKGR